MSFRMFALTMLVTAFAPLAEADELKPVRTLQGTAGSPLWSPNGKRLAIWSGEAILISDPQSGKIVHTLKVDYGPAAKKPDAVVTGMAFVYSPDGKHLAVAAGNPTDGTTVRIYDSATVKQLHAMKSADEVSTLAFSADGKRLFGAGKCPLTVWDVATGKEQVAPDKPPRGTLLSSDGKFLVSVGKGTIRVRDTATGKELTAITVGKGDDFNHLAISPDGKRVAVSGDKLIRVYDVEAKKELHTLRGHGDGPFKISDIPALAFSPDGAWLASGSYDKTVRIWEVATGKERFVCIGHKDIVSSVAWAPDGKWLASSDQKQLGPDPEKRNSVLIWDTSELVAKPK